MATGAVMASPRQLSRRTVVRRSHGVPTRRRQRIRECAADFPLADLRNYRLEVCPPPSSTSSQPGITGR